MATSSASPQGIVPVQVLKDGTGIPTFCVHAVSGVSWPYRVLDDVLDGPIIGIQQAADDGLDEPGSIRAMAARYADRIQANHPGGPYHLLGWSFGGVVAHAVAVELESRGAVVARLVLLDAEPGLSSMANDAVDQTQLEELLDGEFAGYGELLDQVMRNANANVAFYREHETPVFGGDLTVFSAQRDDADRTAFLQRSWRPYAAGDVVVHPVDCTHQEMLTTEALRSYGRRLGQSLGRETM